MDIYFKESVHDEKIYEFMLEYTLPINFDPKTYVKYITPEKEEAGKKKLEQLLQCQHLVNKLIFEYKLNIEFLRAVMEDGVITLQGIADSSVLVERALKISSVEFPNYTIKSAISVVQDFKPYS